VHRHQTSLEPCCLVERLRGSIPWQGGGVEGAAALRAAPSKGCLHECPARAVAPSPGAHVARLDRAEQEVRHVLDAQSQEPNELACELGNLDEPSAIVEEPVEAPRA
jgi:hypothetical protein